MSKDASRDLVRELADVYRSAEESRLANFERLTQEAHLHDDPVCAGQTVWTLHLEPVTKENAVNHPGYVVLGGVVQDTRETTFEITFNGRTRTMRRDNLFTRREDAEHEAQRCNTAIARRLSELHDGELA